MVKFFVGDSKIHGRGVFASEDIQKGKTVFILKGKRSVLRLKTDILSTPNMVGLEKNIWIDPEFPINYLNHSCNPNLGMRGKVLFVAIRNIKKGEEFNFDYSISEDSEWEMRCYCGHANCRKIICGIKSLPESIYRKYLPYIPRYFQKVYQRSHNL
ncbi:MAG TPA: hypothetical protein DCS28_02790 [Candidatus Moranbacteria bacterium]|nr:hypothetical protein [Candidatus Moranbacteria bacterium]HAT74943.1 hypothetical protein [Candidatus Moranbacteria bacterium]